MKKQFLQTQENVSNWGLVLTSSEQMENYNMLQTEFQANHNEIYDADGDGVEDNMDFSSEQLDKFYFPTNFNTAEDI